jgi:hypothetical protein
MPQRVIGSEIGPADRHTKLVNTISRKEWCPVGSAEGSRATIINGKPLLYRGYLIEYALNSQTDVCPVSLSRRGVHLDIWPSTKSFVGEVEVNYLSVLR